jgi:hypothetical protein
MFFSQQALNEMSEAQTAIGGKYESLLMKYVMLPLTDATAKEYATQGFPRRFGMMAHCYIGCGASGSKPIGQRSEDNGQWFSSLHLADDAERKLDWRG